MKKRIVRKTIKKPTKSEHDIQVEIVRSIRALSGFIKGAELIHAIPNGGKRHIKTAIKLKSEGVLSGVPDLFLPVPYDCYHGLYLEVKRPRGVLTDNQEIIISKLRALDYIVEVVHSVKEAQDVVFRYFNAKF